MRDNIITAFLELVDSGILDPRDILSNVLTNFLSNDDAIEFIESEYGDFFEDEDFNEDD